MFVIPAKRLRNLATKHFLPLKPFLLMSIFAECASLTLLTRCLTRWDFFFYDERTLLIPFRVKAVGERCVYLGWDIEGHRFYLSC